MVNYCRAIKRAISSALNSKDYILRRFPMDTSCIWIQICIFDIVFTLQPLRAVGILFSPTVSGWAGGLLEKVYLACISETVRCRKLILGRNICWQCRCATSWYDLDLTFDLAIVTLTLEILSGPYLRNHKV